jgi:hypothetical protein
VRRASAGRIPRADASARPPARPTARLLERARATLRAAMAEEEAALARAGLPPGPSAAHTPDSAPAAHETTAPPPPGTPGALAYWRRHVGIATDTAHLPKKPGGP